MFNFLLNLPRHFIYLMVGLAVFIPTMLGISLAVKPAPEAMAIYDYVDKLPQGSVVLFGQDFDPGSDAELTPMTRAFLKHCFKHRLKVIGVNIFAPEGVALGQSLFKEMEKEFGVKSGVDYAFLGFRPGVVPCIRAFNTDITGFFVTDVNKKETSNMPIFKQVRNGRDIDFMMDIAAGATPEAWITYGASESGYPMAAGCTAVSYASYFMFYQSGQLKGILGGLKGAADYEQLMGISGDGKSGMMAQTAVHVLLIVFIVLGNVTLFNENKKKRLGLK